MRACCHLLEFCFFFFSLLAILQPRTHHLHAYFSYSYYLLTRMFPVTNLRHWQMMPWHDHVLKNTVWLTYFHPYFKLFPKFLEYLAIQLSLAVYDGMPWWYSKVTKFIFQNKILKFKQQFCFQFIFTPIFDLIIVILRLCLRFHYEEIYEFGIGYFFILSFILFANYFAINFGISTIDLAR